jgi:uncharacterized protein YkwD
VRYAAGSKLCFLILIASLSAAVLSCAQDDKSESEYDFVLGETDTLLTCDSDGDGSTAYACQLAYFANRDRATHQEESDGAEPLAWSDELATVALNYSIEMCERGFFDHTDPDGKTIKDRLNDAGITWAKAGENLAEGFGMTPDVAQEMFMDEPECEENHRGNILDNDFTYAGVGAYFCGDVTFYTELFAAFDADDLQNGVNEYCKVN